MKGPYQVELNSYFRVTYKPSENEKYQVEIFGGSRREPAMEFVQQVLAEGGTISEIVYYHTARITDAGTRIEPISNFAERTLDPEFLLDAPPAFFEQARADAVVAVDEYMESRNQDH